MQTRNEPVRAREPFMEMQWKIGNVQIDNPFVLAPMAGVTDLPFRTLCKEQGAGLICMEMISAKAISFHNKNTIALMEIDPCEHPVSMQLFGSEPDLMAEVAKSIEDRDFDILDINMGCPVPKVVNNGEGSALLKNPNLIEEIVRKVSSAISKPLTVKVRIGFENEPVDIVEIAKRIEDAGAAALAVHGRTRQQYYSGTADWDTIRRVKEAITIPVIGNGDVDSPLKAEALVKQTGCDAVVVEDEVDLDKISVGCKVKVHDFEFEEDIELKIVGSTEANSLEGKISNESPVGKALIGAHTGDVVEVEMPAGIMKYKVLEIQRNV